MKIQSFDFSTDIMQVLLWQYNETINLQTLLRDKQNWFDINQETFWTEWYYNVFNLTVANPFGLDIWSIILNLPLFLPIDVDPFGKPIFGFNEVIVFPNYINSYLNFENSNFSVLGSQINLTEEEQRFILRLRYFQLANRGAIPEINIFLNYLCQTSNPAYNPGMYALDGLDMTMTYVFNFQPSEGLINILKSYDLLPRPAGVSLNYSLPV